MSGGERIEHYSSNMRLLVDKVVPSPALDIRRAIFVQVLFSQERKLFLMQVSDHPGLLDTSELLRPEAILKEKVIFTNISKSWENI